MTLNNATRAATLTDSDAKMGSIRCNALHGSPYRTIEHLRYTARKSVAR
jgi:hypothetical protein